MRARPVVAWMDASASQAPVRPSSRGEGARPSSGSSLMRLPDERPAGLLPLPTTPVGTPLGTPTNKIGTPSNRGYAAKPLRPAGLERLPPDERFPVAGGGFMMPAPARPGSAGSRSSNEGRASLQRLPGSDSAPPPQPAASQERVAAPVAAAAPSAAAAATPAPLTLPISKVGDPGRSLCDVFAPPPAGQSAALDHETPQPAKRSGLSAMRERLKKDLQVSTVDTPSPNRGQVFRLLQHGETIQDFYQFAEEIYSGGAKGKVLVAKRKKDGEEVIVKIRTKQTNRGAERSWREIMAQVHSMKGSNHVLDITEILEDELAFYVVMPKCNGGELFEFLVTETEVPEAECKRIIKEILIAIGHLHSRGLVHRDVKPENIMFDMDKSCAKTPKTVKLIDFDTCVEWTPASPKSSRFVGTPGYIAPEALLGEITPQSDLWSVGVILYILMTGETPWPSVVSLEDGQVGSPGAKKMYQDLKQAVVEWDKEPWPEFPVARDLCQKLMAFNTEERACTVREALDHPWLADAPGGPLSEVASVLEEVPDGVHDGPDAATVAA